MESIERDKDNLNRQNGELNKIFDKFVNAITALEKRMDSMDEKLDKLIRLIENGRKN